MKLIKLRKFDLMREDRCEPIYVDPRSITCMRIRHTQHFVVMTKSKMPVTTSHAVITVDGKEIAVCDTVGHICHLIAEACQLEIVESMGIKVNTALVDVDTHIAHRNCDKTGLDYDRIGLCGRDSTDACGRDKPFERTHPIH